MSPIVSLNSKKFIFELIIELILHQYFYIIIISISCR